MTAKTAAYRPPPLSEAQVQVQVRGYLAALGIDAVHVPNGSVLAGDGKARAIQSNALKKAGVLPGFADLILFDRRARRVGFVEVKSAKGSISEAQARFANQAAEWGWPYAVVRSVEDTRAVLDQWGWR